MGKYCTYTMIGSCIGLLHLRHVCSWCGGASTPWHVPFLNIRLVTLHQDCSGNAIETSDTLMATGYCICALNEFFQMPGKDLPQVQLACQQWEAVAKCKDQQKV